MLSYMTIEGASPAGWYPVLRYWDGRQWTIQQAMPSQPPPQQVAVQPMHMVTRPTFWSGGLLGMMRNRTKTTIK